MHFSDRYQAFVNLLHERRGAVSRADLAEQLQLSEKTIARYVTKLIDDGVRVAMEPDPNTARATYQIVDGGRLHARWFDKTSVRTFGLMLELLEQLGYSPIASELAPLKSELQRLTTRVLGSSQMRDKLVIKQSAQRRVDANVFGQLMRAVVKQQRVSVSYQPRSSAPTRQRELSPSHIELYRNNWYLVAWCHTAENWRYFALERLTQIQAKELPSMPGSALPNRRGYGIFDLSAQHTAHLRFSKHRAQWVSEEIWHGQQIDACTPDGQLERKFPFGDPTELIRDLLREGADVQILAPEFLRLAVLERHQECLREAPR